MNNERKTLTLGSLFDGSGGFPLAGVLSGIRPLWASEVEPFAVRVTTKRLPGMKHYGDVSKLSGAELPPVDIITFGSPCQDMSIAGKRAGLEGERSGLFHEAIRIIREMREKTNGEYPRYCVWENVPGAFSSNSGEDFKAVLEAVIGVKEPSAEVPAPGKNGWPYADVYLGDGWSVAYRLLDAQFWGVPQRRARIFLVADFAGERAGDILFKSEGLSGYSAEGFEAWEGTARNPAAGFGAAGGPAVCVNPQGSSGVEITDERTGTLVAQDHGHHPAVLAAGFCTEHSAKSRTIGYEEETSPTLRAGVVPATVYENHSQDSRYTGPLDTAPTVSATYGMGGNNQPFVVEEIAVPYTLKIRGGKEGGGKGALWQEDKSHTLATFNDQALFAPAEQVAFGISSDQSHAMLSGNPHAGVYEAETARTLDAQCGHPGCHQGGIAVVEKAYSLQGNMIGRSEKNGPQGKGIGEEVAFTLTGTDQQGVAAPVYHGTKNSHLTKFSDAPAIDTLVATEYKEPPVISAEPYYIVRRLTPVECARLQGFPDWWCDGLETPEPTEEDIAFWTDVFETHRRVVTQAKKPKTRNQVVKWLQQPYLDSAAYRLWGNGVALPCVWFVLAGIVYCDQLAD